MIVKVRQLLLRIGILLAVIVLIAGLFLLLPRRPKTQAVTIADEAAGAAWLALHGWRTDAPEKLISAVPEQWQTVSGQRFFALQEQQGFAAERFAGETAVRLRYPVRNGSSDAWYAELWLCGDTLAAACIYDAETGVMRPVF